MRWPHATKVGDLQFHNLITEGAGLEGLSGLFDLIVSEADAVQWLSSRYNGTRTCHRRTAGEVKAKLLAVVVSIQNTHT